LASLLLLVKVYVSNPANMTEEILHWFRGLGILCQRQEEYVMASRLIIDGNSVYEIDEDCERSRYGNRRGQSGRGRTGGGFQMKRQEESAGEKPGAGPGARLEKEIP